MLKQTRRKRKSELKDAWLLSRGNEEVDLQTDLDDMK